MDDPFLVESGGTADDGRGDTAGDAPAEPRTESESSPDSSEDLYDVEEPEPPPPEPPADTDPPAGAEDEPAGDEPPSGGLSLREITAPAWEMVSSDFSLMVGAGFIVTTSLGGPSVFTLTGPLLVGYLRIILKRFNREPAAFGELFDGFQDYARAAIAWLVVLALPPAANSLFVVGTWLLRAVLWEWLAAALVVVSTLLAAAVTGALFYWVMPIIAFSPASPSAAIRASVEFGLRRPGSMLLLAAATGVVAAAGLLALGVGWFITFPIAAVMQVIAYREFYLPNALAQADEGEAAEPEPEPDSESEPS